MSLEGAQAIFGTAIVDSTFCQTLLDCPAKAIQGFDLSAEEARALSRIRAVNLQQFALKFERWRLSRATGSEKLLVKWHHEPRAVDRLAG